MSDLAYQLTEETPEEQPQEYPEIGLQPQTPDMSDEQSVSISCLGETVPHDIAPMATTIECPLLENVEKWKIQEFVSDKDTEALDLEQFGIRQSIGGFKADTHYWFVIRVDKENSDADKEEYEIRFMAPYASDVVDFFTEHYFIESIGHSSNLPLDEYIQSYNEQDPGMFVKYAGTFLTGPDGKVIQWSNDSGHFEPEVDYAAAVGEALGITDAMFIPWEHGMEDNQKHTIYYQHYVKYTGPYSARTPGEVIETEQGKEVFYPHDYHQWYQYHGEQYRKLHPSPSDIINNKPNNHSNPLDVVIIFCFILIMIGLCAVTTVFYSTKKKAKANAVNTKVLIDQDEDEDEI